jgi:hypothetical protein
MPITLKDLQSLRRTITVETAAGELNVTYRLGAITPASRAEFDRPGIAGIASHLAQWIEKWDLLDGDEMYPLTEDALMALPDSLLLDVYGAINGDLHTRPTRKAGSFSDS